MKQELFKDLGARERACFAYGQAWGAFMVARGVGDRKAARELLPVLRAARAMCFRRCHRCIHSCMGKCFMRGIMLRGDALAVGCEYYTT